MLKLEYLGPTARITFDQPESRANVLSSAMWDALGAAVADVAGRADVSALVLMSAKPGIFLAGADLNELYSLPPDDPAPARALVKKGLDVLQALESLPIPVAAAIDGACLGGGLEVAMACDFRVAGTHPKCKLGLPEVKLGLIPGWAGTQRLARIIGLDRAAEMLVTGRSLSADEALQAGLVDRVAPGESLESAAVDLLQVSPREAWQDRRTKKREPAPAGTITGARELLASLPAEEKTAGEIALQVLALGNRLPLPMGAKVESESFVPLLASPAARAKMAIFLKK
ncbi:MAG: enoyl-CoA hydratase/isomerase family protein [Gemmataceae bacterium]|nr:enoyl-CoA hydratase/isomerase family protein [Gemmataceae bacterium]